MKAIVLAALMAVMAAPATMAQDTSAGVIRPVRLMTVTNNSDGVTRQFLVTQENVSQGMASDLVSRVFGGSPSALMLSLLDHETLSPDERKQLLDLIEKHRNDHT